MNYAVLAVGIVFLAAGIIMLQKQLKSKKNNTMSVSAKVVTYYEEIKHDSDGDDTWVYYPIMSYSVNGKYYEQKSPVGRGNKKYSLGEQVELMVNPEQPESFIIAGDKTAFILSIAAMVIGFGVVVVSFFA